MKAGHGEADYLLFIDGAPVGVVEAKREGETLTGVELQTTRWEKVMRLPHTCDDYFA